MTASRDFVKQSGFMIAAGNRYLSDRIIEAELPSEDMNSKFGISNNAWLKLYAPLNDPFGAEDLIALRRGELTVSLLDGSGHSVGKKTFFVTTCYQRPYVLSNANRENLIHHFDLTLAFKKPIDEIDEMIFSGEYR